MDAFHHITVHTPHYGMGKYAGDQQQAYGKCRHIHGNPLIQYIIRHYPANIIGTYPAEYTIGTHTVYPGVKPGSVIADILQLQPDIFQISEPSVSEDMEELKRIAALMEVDEIHIFDKTGRIVAGTHPEYYDYTFDSGEQMSFFKPMLEDRSLKLVQDVTPNTAEGKMSGCIPL